MSLIRMNTAAGNLSRGTTGAFRARVVRDVAELQGLAATWDQLRLRLSASPFVGPTFFLAWLEEFGARVAPFVIVVEDEGGGLQGVAPWVRRGPLAFSVPGRFMVAGELLVNEAEAVETWSAVADILARERGLYLTIVPHATDDYAGVRGAAAACERLGVPYRAFPRFARRVLDLRATTYEDHLRGLSRERRRRLKRSRRALERRGAVTLRRVDGLTGYEALRPLHLRQWTPGHTIHWVHTGAGARIDRRLVTELPSEALLLEVDGRTVAAILWIDSGTRRVTLYTTRDVMLEDASPGELVFAEMMRLAFEDGVDELDTMGEGRGKDHLRLERRVGYELAIARPGALGRAALAFRIAQLLARRQIGIREARARSAPRE